MTAAERGLLMLTCSLGDERAQPLTAGEMSAIRTLLQKKDLPPDTPLTEALLRELGLDRALARRVPALLDRDRWLDAYLSAGARRGVQIVTRLSEHYPRRLLDALGDGAPWVLFCLGDPSQLTRESVSLVGSRDLYPMGEAFAARVGALAAEEGLVLCSGNARGADRSAQNACLRQGGRVTAVVAGALTECRPNGKVLYVSLDGYDCAFTTPRAHARNRVIHALGLAVFVAQCRLGAGGTWSGTTDNLRARCSPVYCHADGSLAAAELEKLGAALIAYEELNSLRGLLSAAKTIKEQ